MFAKKKQDDYFPESNDVLIVFDNDQKTSHIRRITEIRENTVYVTGEYAIPVADCEITNSDEGRNFFYRAPAKSIEETQRLANLEKSMVLRHITEYKDDPPEGQADLTKIMLIVTIIIAFIVFGFTGCSG